jgi:hypothetical protein
MLYRVKLCFILCSGGAKILLVHYDYLDCSSLVLWSNPVSSSALQIGLEWDHIQHFCVAMIAATV